MRVVKLADALGTVICHPVAIANAHVVRAAPTVRATRIGTLARHKAQKGSREEDQVIRIHFSVVVLQVFKTLFAQTLNRK